MHMKFRGYAKTNSGSTIELARFLEDRFKEEFQGLELRPSLQEVSFSIFQIRLFLGFKEDLAQALKDYNDLSAGNFSYVYTNGVFRIMQ